MVKQTSKYFASVISKLLAARREENIVVDQNFKQQLREGLAVRAELMAKPQGAGVKGVFTKWRYLFALVPSVLLLMLVAAHVMNLPVEMDSEVVVPVTSTEESDGEAVEGEDLARIEDVKVAVLEDMKKIKTFPGSLVLPEDYGQEVTKVGNGGAKVTSAEITPKVEVAGEMVVPEQDDSYQPQQSGVEYEMLEDIFVEPYDRDRDYSDDDEKDEKNKDSLKVVKTGDGLNVRSDDSAGGLDLPAVDEYVEASEHVEQDQTEYRINYYASLTDAEKADIETMLISPLTSGRAVRNVVVSEIAGSIQVEVYYMDGSNLVKYYEREAREETITSVQYVTEPVVQQTDFQYRVYNVRYVPSCTTRDCRR